MRNIEARHLAVAVVLIVVLAAGAWYWFARFDSSAPLPVEPILETHANAQAAEEDSFEPSPVEPPPVAPAPTTAGDGIILGTVYLTTGERAPAFEVIVAFTPGSNPGEPSRQTVQTGDDGQFRLEHLAFGNYSLLAEDASGVAAATRKLSAEYPAAEVVLVLQPGAALGGTVVDHAGDPVAGATLVAYLHDGALPSREWNDVPAAISGEDGAFVFAGLPFVEWQLHVNAPCCASQLTDPIVVGTLDARIVLDAGAPVSGTVIDAETKAPQPKVRVLAHLRNLDATPAEAVSDKSGAFHFSALAVGAHVIQIDAGDLVLTSGARRLDVPAGGIDDVVLEVLPGGIVRGHILDATTGEGLRGTRIGAYRSGQAAKMRQSGPADDAGAFELRGLEPGEYVLNLVASSALSPMRAGDFRKQVYVRPGERLEGVDFHVLRGLTLSGRVLDVSGEAAPGATVLGRAEHWQDSQNADAQGYFTLAGMKPGMNVNLAATTQSWASKVSGPHIIRDRGIDGIELVLDQPREGLIEGLVVDKTGRPLSARVNAWNRENPLVYYPPQANTDSNGHFLITGVGPGAYSLTVSMLGGWLSQPAMDVTVAPGQHVRNLRLVIDVRPGQDIAGRVVTPENEPIIAFVYLHVPMGGPNGFTSVSTQSGPDGQFRFRSLDPAAYRVRAEAQGYAPAEIEDIQAGDEEVVLVLDPATSVSGQVASTHGEPIPRFDIAAITSGEPGPGNGPEGQYRPVSDPEGRFRLELEAESYALVVRAEGYRAGRTNVDYLLPGEQREGIVIELEPGDPIRGTVITSDGRAVPRAFIFLGPLPVSPYEMAPWAATLSDAAGAFEVYPSRLRPPLTVSAYHPTLGTGQATFELDEDPVIVIEGVGSLRVHVRENGAPAPGVSLYITQASGTFGCTTDDMGDAMVGDLAAGEVQVAFPDGTAAQTVTIVAGELVEVLIDLDNAH